LGGDEEKGVEKEESRKRKGIQNGKGKGAGGRMLQEILRNGRKKVDCLSRGVSWKTHWEGEKS